MQHKDNNEHINYGDDNYRQHLHAHDPDLDPNDPIHTRSSRVDDRRMAPRLESQHLDSNPKFRRTMGADQDIRTARKFTGTLLPNIITNSHTLPAKHSYESQSSGEKEQQSRCRAHILSRNTQEACMRICLLRGRRPRRRRILVLRRVSRLSRRRRRFRFHSIMRQPKPDAILLRLRTKKQKAKSKKTKT